MEKNNQKEQDLAPQNDTARELFSERKDEFIDALECLYIRNNQSGRLMFAEKWPAASNKIFADELLEYDHKGAFTEEERQDRARLENESLEAWAGLVQHLENLDERIVQYGGLKLDVLEGVMKGLDRPLAEYIFAERFVNRYFPVAVDNNQDISESAAASASGKEDLAKGKDGASGAAPTPDAKHNSAAANSAPSVEASQTEGGNLWKMGTHPESDEMDVPEATSRTIGHIDHSFDASIPNYSEGEDGEEGEDMSWLDVKEEEFDDVHPITTEGDRPPPIQNENASRTTQSEGRSSVSDLGTLADSIERQSLQNDTPKDLAGDNADNRDKARNSDDIPATVNDTDRKDEDYTRPMGMERAKVAVQNPGSDKSITPAPAPDTQTRAGSDAQQERAAPTRSGPSADRPVVTTGRVGDAPVRLPMGLRAAQAKSESLLDNDHGKQNPQEDRNQADEVKQGEALKQETPRQDTRAPEAQGQDEERKPRIPSLDDLDKHMPADSGQRNAGFPPIPGSDDNEY